MAIEAAHYGETRARLKADPIVREMAATVATEHLPQLAAWDGTPRFAFMQAANREYAARGGQDGGHIGAVAEAIIELVKGRTHA